jgi:pyridoxal 5'-phosphate synthase glutaminase subunit Pdx2
MKVGVLALQGDVREHFRALEDCGVTPVAVRRPREIEEIDALVIPGGESTTIAHLAQTFGVFELIQKRIRAGLPIYGLKANELSEDWISRFAAMLLDVKSIRLKAIFHFQG